jgi:hypothetical protein
MKTTHSGMFSQRALANKLVTFYSHFRKVQYAAVEFKL